MNNFAQRSVFGTIFVVLTVACLFNKYAFVVFFALAMTAMLHEFYAMTLGGSHRAVRILAHAASLLCFALMFFVAGFHLKASWLTLSLLPLVMITVAEVFARDKGGIDSLSHIFTGLVYIALPVVLSPLLVFRGGGYSGLMLLSFFIIIWCSDVGAYCLGTAFGQKPTSRKLCPEISPKKSWIGVFGGLFFAVVSSVILHFTGLLELGLGHCIVLSVIIMAGGVFGDLFESLWKRHYGLKDSGNIIPGHGGILDRFDSSLVAFPLAAVYIALVV